MRNTTKSKVKRFHQPIETVDYNAKRAEKLKGFHFRTEQDSGLIITLYFVETSDIDCVVMSKATGLVTVHLKEAQ